MWDNLREELRLEKIILDLQNRIKYIKPAESIKFLTLQIVPDAINLETRISIKIFTSILQEAFNNIKGQLTSEYKDINSKHKREELYKSEIEYLLNNEILGNTSTKF